MKELMNAIKTALAAAESLEYVNTATGIWITPDEDIVPMAASFPGIGIKDGPVSRVMHTNIQWEVHQDVMVVVYVQLSSGDTPIVGKTGETVIHGLLDIAADINAVLSENYLGISGMEQAWCKNEDAVQVIGDADFVLAKKTLYFEYIKEEIRP